MKLRLGGSSHSNTPIVVLKLSRELSSGNRNLFSAGTWNGSKGRVVIILSSNAGELVEVRGSRYLPTIDSIVVTSAETSSGSKAGLWIGRGLLVPPTDFSEVFGLLVGNLGRTELAFGLWDVSRGLDRLEKDFTVAKRGFCVVVMGSPGVKGGLPLESMLFVMNTGFSVVNTGSLVEDTGALAVVIRSPNVKTDPMVVETGFSVVVINLPVVEVIFLAGNVGLLVVASPRPVVVLGVCVVGLTPPVSVPRLSLAVIGGFLIASEL